MAAKSLRVEFTRAALLDLHEISDYWTERDEPERGEQYMRDLYAKALDELSDPAAARAGRFLQDRKHTHVQEIFVYRRSYRILYRVWESEEFVEVMRFWHSHRDEPFDD